MGSPLSPTRVTANAECRRDPSHVPGPVLSTWRDFHPSVLLRTLRGKDWDPHSPVTSTQVQVRMGARDRAPVNTGTKQHQGPARQAPASREEGIRSPGGLTRLLEKRHRGSCSHQSGHAALCGSNKQLRDFRGPDTKGCFPQREAEATRGWEFTQAWQWGVDPGDLLQLSKLASEVDHMWLPRPSLGGTKSCGSSSLQRGGQP